MATTTNYSWSTPDDTALVKDGAAAIRTLGSSADTTVKALNPGTTAGDLDYYTTSTAKARLAIGTANQQLRVNSGATAPEWFTPGSAGGMTLISTTTLTGSSVTLSSIPQTYKNLQLIIRNYKPSVDGNGFQIRVNADSGANRHYSGYGSMQNINQAFNATLWIVGGPDNTTANGITVLNFYDYTNTATWKLVHNFLIQNHETNAANLTMEQSHHAYNQTDAITSLVLSVSSGTYTGEVLLYGVA